MTRSNNAIRNFLAASSLSWRWPLVLGGGDRGTKNRVKCLAQGQCETDAHFGVWHLPLVLGGGTKK
jgi:hypothetical protein